MINSNTSFANLKTVIVGRELELKKRIADFAFKYFYQENLNQTLFGRLNDGEQEYYVNHDLIIERNNDLDNLAKVLEAQGIKTLRPDKLTSVIPIQTPHFKSELSAASNVRDLSLIYKNIFLETPVFVPNRYFENLALYDCIKSEYKNGKGGLWVKSPNTNLSMDTLDLSPWNSIRDYNNFDENKYVMAIDGAQFLRIGKDVIVNINSYNHYLGLQWVKSFFPESNFHIVNIADNHIDGAIACLAPGKFLINPKYPNIKELMPEKFKNWEYLFPKEMDYKDRIKPGMTNIDVQLASSRGMDINILSISPNKVVVSDNAFSVIDLLEKNKFEVIPVKLSHSEIFGGGIHCSTLDIYREDEYVSFI